MDEVKEDVSEKEAAKDIEPDVKDEGGETSDSSSETSV